MTIVLNERDWAEEMIASRSLGKKPFETMCRVARYYFDNGFSRKKIRRMLDSFLIQCDPSASLTKWSDALDHAVSRAMKYEAINIDSIDITVPEMEKIDSLDGRQLKRLAFVLLCLAKYWNIVLRRPDGWVNNKDSDIMRMANINTSIKRQSLMFSKLKQSGLIDFSRKVDNTNVRVCFFSDGDIAMRVTDFRNLGYQYMMYHGGPYFVCANCGMTVKESSPRGRKQIYCRKCANDVAIQRRVNNAMTRRRERKYTVYMHEFPDGRVYIGSTCISLRDRWKNGNGYRGMKVGDAIDSVGWENVKHYILFCGADKNLAKAVEANMIAEKKSYMQQYGYNNHELSSMRESYSGIIPDCIIREVDGNGMDIS